MKLFTHLFVFSMLFFQSCMIGGSIKGNGHIISKEFAISDYTEIESSGVAEIVYEQQTIREPYLQVNVDENILNLLEVKVENNKLIIKYKDSGNIHPSRFTVYTNSSNLKKIKLAGSGEIRLKGEVNSKSLKVDLAGSGDIVADSLYCEKFDMSVAGSGTARLKGASNVSKFNIAGSGDIKGSHFSVGDLECKVAGSGDIQITVSESLKATVAGSGNLRYYGNPKVINTKVTGSGNIRRLD